MVFFLINLKVKPPPAILLLMMMMLIIMMLLLTLMMKNDKHKMQCLLLLGSLDPPLCCTNSRSQLEKSYQGLSINASMQWFYSHWIRHLAQG